VISVRPEGGNESGGVEIDIDTKAPGRVLIDGVTDDVGPHTGALQKGDVTDDARPTIVGTAEPHATISVYSNDELLGTTVADKDGNWSFTPEEGKALAEGLNDLTVTATNAAGNVSVPTGKFPIVVDLTAPELGEVKLVDDFGQVTGHIVSGTVTDDNLPTYVGKIEGEAGGKVIVFDNDKPIGEAEISPDGSWAFTPKEALEDGEHRFEFQVIDKAGNVGEKSEAIDFVVDTREVEVSIVRAEDNFGSKQGNLSSGDVTDDETPTLVGKATAGGLVTIHVGGQVLGTAVADKDGNWSFIVPEADKLGHGQHEFTATVTTGANGQSQHTQVFVLDIDLQAPNKPSIEQAYDDVHNQVGPVSNGGHTNDTTPTLSGRAEAHSTVYIYAEGIGLLDKVTAKADGTWEYTPTTELPNGQYSFTVKSEDKAGNLSEASEPYVVIVDTVAPNKPIIETVYDDQGAKTGNISNGDTTDDLRPTLSGSAEAGSEVIIYLADQKIGRTFADENGNWAFTPDNDIVYGRNDFVAQSIDKAGNISELSAPFTVNVGSSGYVDWEGTQDGWYGSQITNNGLTVTGIASTVHIVSYVYDGVGLRSLQVLQGKAAEFVFDDGPAESVSFIMRAVNGSLTMRYYSADNVLLHSQDYIGNDHVGDDYDVYYSHETIPVAYFVADLTLEVAGVVFDNISWGPQSVSARTIGHDSIYQEGEQTSAIYSEDNIFKLADVADLDEVRVEGNEGIDTLKLLGGDQTLDLSALAGKISSVEIFDITGSGKNTLKLSLADVLENGAQNLFADDDNVQLMVKGDAGDRLELNDLLGTGGMDLGDWGEQGQLTSGGIVYNVYQHSGMAAEVLVQAGVDVNLNNHG